MMGRQGLAPGQQFPQTIPARPCIKKDGSGFFISISVHVRNNQTDKSDSKRDTNGQVHGGEDCQRQE